MKKSSTPLFLFFLFLTLAALIPAAPKAYATAALAKSVAGDKAAEAPTPLPADELGRNTPRGTVAGFLDAIGKEDLERASQYLDLRKVSQSRRKTRGPEIAREMQLLLDKGGWFYPGAMLSNAPEGHKDEEELETGFDRIGNIRADGKDIDILAEQVSNEDGTLIWLISGQTLDKLPEVDKTVAEAVPPINKFMPATMIETKVFGAPIGHWLAMLVLLVVSYLFCWFLVMGLLAFLKKIWTRKCSVAGTHLLDTIRVPLSLYLSVWVFGYSSMWLGISIIIRQHMSQLNVIVAWSAIALLAWRLIDILTESVQKRLVANGRFFGFSSILFFFRRLIKIVFGIVLLFILLDNLGVDVTAGLAALGIGGIALALGAQKTLENFIGSLAIVIDQPLHIGDYCKIGDAAGTVEDIGMRSTRLRTNDRTLITIPNGDLSNQRIENLARRNRFLVNKKFQLRYDAKSEQIRLFTKKTEELLFDNEHVTEEGFPVRYLGPGQDGHQMELFFYINVEDNNEYLKIQQELMLKMADLIDSLSLYYIIPSQTMLPAVDQRGRPTTDKPVTAASE